MKRLLAIIIALMLFGSALFAQTTVYPIKRIDNGVITDIHTWNKANGVIDDPGIYAMIWDVDNDTTGVVTDTVNFLIPFDGYNAGWFLWGINSYSTSHNDTTTCYMTMSLRPGTIFRNSWREPNGVQRFFKCNNRGKHTDLIDTLYPTGAEMQGNLDSLFCIPLDSAHVYAGGWLGADSTFKLDWLNLEVIVVDSQSVTDDRVATDQTILFDVMGKFYEAVWRQR